MGKDYDMEETMKPTKKPMPKSKPVVVVKKPTKGCGKKK